MYRCPECQAPGLVKHTRADPENGEVRRRHHCPKCGHRYTTIETLLLRRRARVRPDLLDKT